VETDVQFDSTVPLNAYPGAIIRASNGRTLIDFYRLALHEFGHAAGLGHPNVDGGQTVAAIMNQGVNQALGATVDDLQADDIAGVHAINWNPGSLIFAVLPSSRSVQVDSTATAFVTVLNTGGTAASGVRLALETSIPARFSFQATDSRTNRATGSPNTPVDIPAGGRQSFVIGITPTAAFAETDVSLRASSSSSDVAAVVSLSTGLDTILITASNSPVPDIVALAATLSGDGIVSVPGPNGSGAFSVATVNVGTTGTITVSVDTGTAILPGIVELCQTNPATGVCLIPISSSVTTTINANATPTFGIFGQASGAIPFDPSTNRLFVRFRDTTGVTRGATSVAVRTQ
jgi:hypothetical protein